MPLSDNERVQEFALLAGDKLSLVDKKWWFALIFTIVIAIPAYFSIRFGFLTLLLNSYSPPEITRPQIQIHPLEVTASGIFDLGNNNYSGYVKIRNIEFNWGVPNQTYTAEFKTYGGSTTAMVSGSTYILPSSEKLIVFSHFSADRKPDELKFGFGQTHFIRRASMNYKIEIERKLLQNPSSGLIVSAGVKNKTPYKIKQINLPVAVYDNKNQIVAVNFTNINDVLSGETRTFQYSWPTAVAGAVRAEIMPEVNIFDPTVFQAPDGVSPIQ